MEKDLSQIQDEYYALNPPIFNGLNGGGVRHFELCDISKFFSENK